MHSTQKNWACLKNLSMLEPVIDNTGYMHLDEITSHSEDIKAVWTSLLDHLRHLKKIGNRTQLIAVLLLSILSRQLNSNYYWFGKLHIIEYIFIQIVNIGTNIFKTNFVTADGLGITSKFTQG